MSNPANRGSFILPPVSVRYDLLSVRDLIDYFNRKGLSQAQESWDLEIKKMPVEADLARLEAEKSVEIACSLEKALIEYRRFN